MKRFTKILKRVVIIRSVDPALSHAPWYLEVGPRGVSIRRKGEHSTFHLSWRSIIGHALIHSAGAR